MRPSPSGALNPPPEGMRPGTQQVDLVGNDGGRVDPVSILLSQLQADELRSVGLCVFCVWSGQVRQSAWVGSQGIVNVVK